MISTIGGLFNLNHFDQTSGSNDVIVIRHRDGSLHSTPFNVRFGRAKLWNSANKVVEIEVNGSITSAVMKIGRGGVAHWLRPNYNNNNNNSNNNASTAHVRGFYRPESPIDDADVDALTADVVANARPAQEVEQQLEPNTRAAPRGISDDEDESPFVVQQANGEWNVRPGAIHSAADAQEAALALDALNAVERSTRRLDRSRRAHSTTSPTTAPNNNNNNNADPLAAPTLEAAGGSDSDVFSQAEDEYALESLNSDDFGEARDAEDCNDDDDDDDTSTSGFSAEEEDALASATAANAHPPTDGVAPDCPFYAVPPAPRRSSNNNNTHGPHFFTRSLVPTHDDLLKLHLVDGCNRVRYLTLKRPDATEVVAVSCNVFLWNYNDRIVVSDIDGTITKSDLLGHFYAMIGKGGDWTHPGICSLYSKIHNNGYRMVYLTARSVSQMDQTKSYLWSLCQDNATLPLGPVLTAPQRFFTALTQEVSKQSHVFKIACLKSVYAAFPTGSHHSPFFAGFGNRYNDVISYDAVGIPAHRTFIIDPSGVLIVCSIRQSYHNLAHLVDATFPPRRIQQYTAKPTVATTTTAAGDDQRGGRRGAERRQRSPGFWSGASNSSACSDDDRGEQNGSALEAMMDLEHTTTFSLLTTDLSRAPAMEGEMRVEGFPLNDDVGGAAAPPTDGDVRSGGMARRSMEEEEPPDAEFGSYNYWRINPSELVATSRGSQPLSTMGSTTALSGETHSTSARNNNNNNNSHTTLTPPPPLTPPRQAPVTEPACTAPLSLNGVDGEGRSTSMASSPELSILHDVAPTTTLVEELTMAQTTATSSSSGGAASSSGRGAPTASQRKGFFFGFGRRGGRKTEEEMRQEEALAHEEDARALAREKAHHHPDYGLMLCSPIGEEKKATPQS